VSIEEELELGAVDDDVGGVARREHRRPDAPAKRPNRHRHRVRHRRLAERALELVDQRVHIDGKAIVGSNLDQPTARSDGHRRVPRRTFHSGADPRDQSGD
jgi:hypothetical protein